VNWAKGCFQKKGGKEMSKKLLITILAIVVGLFATSAFAYDFGDIAYLNRNQGVTGHTAGVVVNPEGKGDLLIFPYYDVRPIGTNAQETWFAVINEETGDTVGGTVCKLRFLEWDKSEEVFDAEIWLSRSDVWVGVLTQSSPTKAKIYSPDYVVTAFDVNTFTLTTPLAAGFEFPGPPIGSANMDNRMGYFYVIGSERTFSKATPGTSPLKVSRYQTLAERDCPNIIMGYAYIVRVADGVALGYNATAIANFSKNQGSLFIGACSI